LAAARAARKKKGILMKRMADLLAALASTVVLQFGVLSCFSQSYLFTGAKTTVTLNPGTYEITAFGARGGSGIVWPYSSGSPGLGAKMKAAFSFTTATTLTILVGGAGINCGAGGGGGGGSFVVNGSTPLLVAGGGGGGCGTYGKVGGSALTNSSGGIGDGSGLTSTGALGGNSGYGGSNGNGGNGGQGGGGGGFSGDGGIAILGGYANGGYGGTNFLSGGGGGQGGLGAGFPYGGYGGGGGGGENGGGGGGGYSGGGGGDNGGGAGGGSYIDSSAKTILAEVSGIASPDDAANGEIIITAVIPPLTISTGAVLGFTNGVFGFDVSGPSGSNMVIQASIDMKTWIPIQTNLLGSGPLYFSDSQSTTNAQRFYRAFILP
jgi:hypothetical protein